MSKCNVDGEVRNVLVQWEYCEDRVVKLQKAVSALPPTNILSSTLTDAILKPIDAFFHWTNLRNLLSPSPPQLANSRSVPHPNNLCSLGIPFKVEIRGKVQSGVPTTADSDFMLHNVEKSEYITINAHAHVSINCRVCNIAHVRYVTSCCGLQRRLN